MMRLFLVAVLLVAAPTAAVNPDEILDDPVLEARARDLSKLLRCVVCQKQSIDDSNASLVLKDANPLRTSRCLTIKV